MSQTTNPPPVVAEPSRDEEIAPTTTQTHGYASTEERLRELRAVAGRRKGDPSMDRLMEEVDRYREQLRQEEIAAQDAERDK